MEKRGARVGARAGQTGLRHALVTKRRICVRRRRSRRQAHDVAHAPAFAAVLELRIRPVLRRQFSAGEDVGGDRAIIDAVELRELPKDRAVVVCIRSGRKSAYRWSREPRSPMRQGRRADRLYRDALLQTVETALESASCDRIGASRDQHGGCYEDRRRRLAPARPKSGLWPDAAPPQPALRCTASAFAAARLGPACLIIERASAALIRCLRAK